MNVHDRNLAWRDKRIADLEARLDLVRKALERIAASRANDMNTLHPEGCAYLAARTLRAIDSEELP